MGGGGGRAGAPAGAVDVVVVVAVVALTVACRARSVSAGDTGCIDTGDWGPCTTWTAVGCAPPDVSSAGVFIIVEALAVAPVIRGVATVVVEPRTGTAGVAGAACELDVRLCGAVLLELEVPVRAVEANIVPIGGSTSADIETVDDVAAHARGTLAGRRL